MTTTTTETRERIVTAAETITDEAYTDRLHGIARSWRLQIRTSPTDQWHAIGGWGPWTNAPTAREALISADAQWMAARLIERVEHSPAGYLPKSTREWKRV